MYHFGSDFIDVMGSCAFIIATIRRRRHKTPMFFILEIEISVSSNAVNFYTISFVLSKFFPCLDSTKHSMNE